MGYFIRPGTQITDFWPDDTETEMYVVANSDYSIADLLEMAKEKWPDATPENVSVSSEKVHTNCIYYDLYDSGDYTDFVILKKN
jgi:hypothetical protein